MTSGDRRLDVVGVDDQQVSEGRQREDTHQDDSDMTSTSSSMDITVDDDDMQKLIELEQRLEDSGGGLDDSSRKEYVSLLRRCGMKEKLREVRYALNGSFPLDETMWLEWIQDESEALTTVEDVVRLEELLRSSHADFVSVSLWKEHLEVAKAMLMQHKLDVATVRGLFEDALCQCGVHMSEGHILWNACLDFEMSLEGDERDDERIMQIFYRYLRTPFAPEIVKAVQERYAEWGRGGDIPDAVMKGISRAQRAYSLREEYEAALSLARNAEPHGSELLSVYYSYIHLEVSGGSHDRVRMVFERAIVDFPRSEFLWKSLLSYEECEGREDQLPDLHVRAIRCCPWSGDIWSMYITQVSRYGTTTGKNDQDTLDTLLQKASKYLHDNPLEYQKALLARAFVLRQAGATFKSTYEELLREGIRLLKERHVVDPEHHCATLLSYSLAAGGDFDAGKAVWESLISDAYMDAQYSGTWMSYFTYVERFGEDFPQSRNIFHRSIKAQMSLADHAYLARTWLLMEEKQGTSESRLHAELATRDISRTYEASQLGINRDLQEVLNVLETKRRGQDKHLKRKRENLPSEPAKKKNQAPPSSEKRPEKPQHHAKSSQNTKFIVFVKHIVPSVTEKDLVEEFSSCGEDIDVTIGRDPKTDRSKGYAYIRCESKQTFDTICALDGKEFHGKSLFIAPSAPPKGSNTRQLTKGNESKRYAEPRERSQKQRLPPQTTLVPRSAIVGAPKSNEDFRNMFLSSSRNKDTST